MDTVTLGGIFARVGGALALVLLTFNPSGFSYFHWVKQGFPSVTPPQAVVGILLLCKIFRRIRKGPGLLWIK